MNSAYQNIIAATPQDRLGLFVATATRMGTTLQNIEKDFWVCWTLDALFHRLPKDRPRLLFKGGTSLSKVGGLISRFSEDIDVTVFREDLGVGTPLETLEGLSGKKQRKHLENVLTACQSYINDTLLGQLNDFARATAAAAKIDPATLHVVPDASAEDRQSLLIHYPSVADGAGYVGPSVKIESGAKSALDPHEGRTIVPYVAADMRNSAGLEVPGVTTIHAERTFLDKILILHGMTYYHDEYSKLRGEGRMSRHYYDVHTLMKTPVGAQGCVDNALIEDCVRHAQMFFYRSHTGLDVARRGSFRLSPAADMIPLLRADYAAMSGMIFGEVPPFEAVLDSISKAERLLNAVG